MLHHPIQTNESGRSGTPRKRPFAAVLAVLLVTFTVVTTPSVPAAAGLAPCSLPGIDTALGAADAGSADNPFAVADAEDLDEVGELCGLDAAYLQIADIDLQDRAANGTGEPFTHQPIGTVLDPFVGIYDGGGFEIRGLLIDLESTDGVGLFGQAGASVEGEGTATLRNIHLVDVDVTGKRFVGALAGFSIQGTIIEDSSSSGVVEGAREVGGLVGYVSGSVTRSSSTADVTASTAIIAGGLIGNLQGGAVTQSFATGAVAGPERVGGLIGDSLTGSARITDSYATGSVTGSVRRVGGLVGNGGDPLFSSYAAGSVSGTTTDVGGLAGRGEPDDSDSFWDVDVTGQATTSGTPGGTQNGRTTAQMKTIATFADADWKITAVWEVPGTNVWGICADVNNGYPYLLWQFTAETLPLTCPGAASLDDDDDDINDSDNTDDADDADDTDNDADDTDNDADTENGDSDADADAENGDSDGAEAGGSQTDGGDDVAGSSPSSSVTPLLSGGLAPALSAGQGVWQQADGTSVPLQISSPGSGQLRYAAAGLTITLTGSGGSSTSGGLVADAAGEILCEVCTELESGGVIEAWMFSSPRLVAARAVTDAPCQTFTVPLAAPLDGGGPVSAGAHTLQIALPTASGMQAVNVGVTVGGPVPASVPAGEGTLPAPFTLLVAALLIGAGVVIIGRRSLVTG
jgi:hypothetical protein